MTHKFVKRSIFLINSKWIKDLSVRPETIKLLEENIGKTLFDKHHSRILYSAPGWGRQHHSQRDPPFVPRKRLPEWASLELSPSVESW